MTMTPVCINCGDIPIAEASFKALEDKVKLYEDVLTQIAKFSECGADLTDEIIDFAKRTLAKANTSNIVNSF
jgi:uncharacterized protein YbbK (DUF523 family)